MLQRPSWYQQTSRVSLKSSTEAVLLLDMLIETERGGGGEEVYKLVIIRGPLHWHLAGSSEIECYMRDGKGKEREKRV